MAQHRMKVTRELKYSYETVWPDDYPGMSWEETLEYERKLELGEIIEGLHDSDELEAKPPRIEITEIVEEVPSG